MGRIGSKEMYLIWENFGITEMCSGLIDITGSTKNKYTNLIKINISKQSINWLLMPKKDDQLLKH